MPHRVKVADQATQEWRARNPLRRWLSRQKRGTIKEIMRVTGVDSRAAVFAWMHGRNFPPMQKLLAIHKLTHIRPQTYLGWWLAKPGGRKTCPEETLGRSTRSGS